jgi:hypothetical protein
MGRCGRRRPRGALRCGGSGWGVGRRGGRDSRATALLRLALERQVRCGGERVRPEEARCARRRRARNDVLALERLWRRVAQPRFDVAEARGRRRVRGLGRLAVRPMGRGAGGVGGGGGGVCGGGSGGGGQRRLRARGRRGVGHARSKGARGAEVRH